MTGRLRALAVTVAAALALLVPVGAAAAPPPEDLPAASWILIDAESGDLLAERAANEARPIASATKLMTAYLALRELNPADAARAVNRDVLVPKKGGRFAFGRLIDRQGDKVGVLPPGHGEKQQVVESPAWIGVAEMLVRRL